MPPSSTRALLKSHLLREQRAFLGRDRAGWSAHLEAVRAFLGDGFRSADPDRSVLVLGAGAGLEVPWSLAPRQAYGWDADPWSRMRTLVRHRRWMPWFFGDVTGALDPLLVMLQRNVRRDWRGHSVGSVQVARTRIAGLLDSLLVRPQPLADTIRALEPGLIVASNLMGQFGVVAEALVERSFGSPPWEPDPERPDPLAEAMDRWTARVVRAFLGTLAQSGAGLVLVHDRAILEEAVPLGAWHPDWRQQILAEDGLEAQDPLAGVDALDEVKRTPIRAERWLWPVGRGQVHLVEALAFSGDAAGSAGGSPAR